MLYASLCLQHMTISPPSHSYGKGWLSQGMSIVDFIASWHRFIGKMYTRWQLRYIENHRQVLGPQATAIRHLRSWPEYIVIQWWIDPEQIQSCGNTTSEIWICDLWYISDGIEIPLILCRNRRTPESLWTDVEKISWRGRRRRLVFRSKKVDTVPAGAEYYLLAGYKDASLSGAV